MRNLAVKNEWGFGNPRYYGSCIEKINNQLKIKKGKKISDVMKSWMTDKLTLECLSATLVFYYLKLYRIYGTKIDLIVKTCFNSKKRSWGKNLDNKPLFYWYDHKLYIPQKNLEDTLKLLNTEDYHFGYIRTGMGWEHQKYLKIDYSKINSRYQGSNIFKVGDNFGEFTNMNYSNIYKKPNNAEKASYLVWGIDDTKLSRLSIVKKKSYMSLTKNKTNPKLYDHNINYKINNINYRFYHWYGLTKTFKISYLLPTNFK